MNAGNPVTEDQSMAIKSMRGSDFVSPNGCREVPSSANGEIHAKKQRDKAFISAPSDVKRLKPSAVRDSLDGLLNDNARKPTIRHCLSGAKEEGPLREGSDHMRTCVNPNKDVPRKFHNALLNGAVNPSSFQHYCNGITGQYEANKDVKEGMSPDVSDFPKILEILASPAAITGYPDSTFDAALKKMRLWHSFNGVADEDCIADQWQVNREVKETGVLRKWPDLLGILERSASPICVKTDKTALRDFTDGLLNCLECKSSIVNNSDHVIEQSFPANPGQASLEAKEVELSKDGIDVKVASEKSDSSFCVKAGKIAVRGLPDVLLNDMVKYCSSGMANSDQCQMDFEVKQEVFLKQCDVQMTSTSLPWVKADDTVVKNFHDTLFNGMVNKCSSQYCSNSLTNQYHSNEGQAQCEVKQDKTVKEGSNASKWSAFSCVKKVKKELPDSNEVLTDISFQHSSRGSPEAVTEFEKPPSASLKVDRSGISESEKGASRTQTHSFKGHSKQSLTHSKAIEKIKNESDMNKSVRSPNISKLCEVPGNDAYEGEFGSHKYMDGEGLDGSGKEMNYMVSCARSLVKRTLHEFDCIRKTLVKAQQPGKRPDYEAANILKSKNRLRNCGVIGEVPGIEVGDQFTFRIEMCLVGLHRQTQGGIDFISGSKRINGPIATSIVASGCYEDDDDYGDTFIYTGQGGNNFRGNKRQEKDQKLVRGNLALKNCMLEHSPVRVIRGYVHSSSPSDKLYTYDGLYSVVDVWEKPGLAGFKVFQFKLTRQPGQPQLGSSIVRFVGSLKKKGIARPNLLLEDISGGQEKLPVCVVNEVDEEPAPTAFVYISQMKYPLWYTPVLPRGCDCIGKCLDERRCLCAAKNGGEFPYNELGYLIFDKQVVYECGSSCQCSSSCQNRVSQKGLRYRLEVFKTKNRGWGVWSLNPIQPGGFICEYTGELLSDAEAERRTGNDEYLFDLGYKCSTRTDVSELMGKREPSNADTSIMEEAGFTIDANGFGSVARFINHCCSPNLFAQNVLYDSDDFRFPHVMLFAMENIPPMRELNYDYNYAMGHVRDSDGNVKTKACYCGSLECTGRLY